jgi:hypothetical protein
MGNQRIDYNHVLAYIIAENNAIGPTTSLTLRTLDNPSPNDTNAIWLAPNGSDAAAGTQAAPVLTLETAIDKLQAGAPTVTTIHIFRNGYVGDLEFTATDDHYNADKIPINSIIQVELGEIAYITFSSSGQWDFQNAGKLNGLEIEISNTVAVGEYAIIGVSEIKWFRIFGTENVSIDRFMNLELGTGGSGNVFCKQSIIDGSNGTTQAPINVFEASSTPDILIENSIIISTAIACMTIGSIAPNSVLVEHCTMKGVNRGLDLAIPNITAKNNIFDGIPNPISKTTSGTTVFQYNLVSRANYSLQLESGETTTDNNNISGIIPLFFDSANKDFRLMDQRRTAPNSNELFSFTSAAVYNTDLVQTPSDDSKDLGPYDVSYSLTTDTWEEFEVENEFWNAQVNIDHVFVNYQPFEDIRGNHRRSFDGIRRRIAFKMVGNNFTGTEDSYKLRDLLRSEGSKRWYPIGNDGMFTDPSGTVTVNSDGDFETTLSVITNLIPNSFEGFVCEVSSGASTYYLRIKEHSSGSLVLEDHRENQSGMGSGIWDLTCLYLPVEIDQQQASQVFECWDPKENPLMITPSGSLEHWEGHIRELVVKETEEDE